MALNIGNIRIGLTVDTKRLRAGFAKAGKIARGFTKQLGEMRQRVFNLKTAIIGLAGAYGVGRLAKSFITVGSYTEDLQQTLVILLGDVEEGARLFEDLATYASTVPFQLEEIMQGATMLSGIMKGGRKEIMGWMPAIGDLAAVVKPLGIEFTSTVEQIMRMLSAGAAAADRFREKGVLNMLGFTAGAKYTAEQTAKILKENLPKFEGASLALAQTWSGAMSMMADAWFRFKDMVMKKGLLDFLKGFIGVILDKIKQMEKEGTLGKWAETIAHNVKEAVVYGLEMLGTVMDTVQSSIEWVSKNKIIAEWGLIGYVLMGKKGAVLAAALARSMEGYQLIFDELDALTAKMDKPGKVGFLETLKSTLLGLPPEILNVNDALSAQNPIIKFLGKQWGITKDTILYGVGATEKATESNARWSDGLVDIRGKIDAKALSIKKLSEEINKKIMAAKKAGKEGKQLSEEELAALKKLEEERVKQLVAFRKREIDFSKDMHDDFLKATLTAEEYQTHNINKEYKERADFYQVMLNVGIINHEQFTQKILEAEAILAAETEVIKKEVAEKIKEAEEKAHTEMLERVREEQATLLELLSLVGRSTEDAFAHALDDMTIHGKSFTESMKNMFKDLVTSIVHGINRMIAKWLAWMAIKAIGKAFGLPTELIPTGHAGGLVPGGLQMKRFHTGGLASNEVAAVLRRGEFVVREEAARAFLPMLQEMNRYHSGGLVDKASSVGGNQYNITIQATDADSFKELLRREGTGLIEEVSVGAVVAGKQANTEGLRG